MDTLRKVLRCKIHRATVTGADVNYEGSITVPPELMRAAGLVAYEAVNVWNVTSGTRFETYAITAESESGQICVNGAAAHLVTPGDLVIIAAFQLIPESRITGYVPTCIFVDGKNRITEQREEVPGPKRGSNALVRL